MSADNDPRFQTDTGYNMLCACGGPTFVIDCRFSTDGACRRRRVCKKCKERFTTYERREEAMPPPIDALRFLLRDIEVTADRVRKMIEAGP